MRYASHLKSAAAGIALAMCQCTSVPSAPPASPSLSAVGAPELAPMMDRLWAEYGRRNSTIAKGENWTFDSEALAIGALMFDRADIAPVTRTFTKAELAPYAHQFHGDMMREPAMFQIATTGSGPIFLAVNRRPDSPLPEAVNSFLSFALSAEGQAAIAGTTGYHPLSNDMLNSERAQLNGFVAPLDENLPAYLPRAGLSGEIRSVGSDGMKALMDRWQRNFHALHPKVKRGEAWEHLGTLNGFHALIAGETDLAPMGRELWPEELDSYRSVFGEMSTLLEIRVARGGFDTPQRTTAQAIFVHPDNPLNQIDLGQIKRIFSAENPATTWGDLGLSGEWADLPIEVRTPPQVAPNSVSMKLRLFPSADWSPRAVESSVQDTAAAVAGNRAAIAFGGFEDDGDLSLKTLAVSETAGGPYIEGSHQSAADGTYPLTRYMFIRLQEPESGKLAPEIQAFLRFILSREGQDDVRYSGYFPLTAAEVRQELQKLDAY